MTLNLEKKKKQLYNCLSCVNNWEGLYLTMYLIFRAQFRIINIFFMFSNSEKYWFENSEKDGILHTEIRTIPVNNCLPQPD